MDNLKLTTSTPTQTHYVTYLLTAQLTCTLHKFFYNISKFITNKFHLYVSSAPLLHVSSIIHSHLHEYQYLAEYIIFKLKIIYYSRCMDAQDFNKESVKF